jgi:hypothetical protein
MVDFPVFTVISIEFLNNATAFNLVMLSKMSVTMRKKLVRYTCARSNLANRMYWNYS